MRKLLFFIALIGFVLSLVVHLFSLAHIDLTDRFSFLWLLHICIFIVWVPAVLDVRKNSELNTYMLSARKKYFYNPFTFFKLLLKNVPRWLIVLVIVCFCYATINFLLFMFDEHGTPSIKDGQYVLLNHGQLIKNITAEEYEHYKANVARGFSGHWMLFYAAAAAILYPFNKKSLENKESAN